MVSATSSGVACWGTSLQNNADVDNWGLITFDEPAGLVTVALNGHPPSYTGTHKVRINSYHHQAVKDLAPGFKIAARSPDGVIEAIESTMHPFVTGVQWHPELTYTELDFNLGVFRAFVEAAAKARARTHGDRKSVV